MLAPSQKRRNKVQAFFTLRVQQGRMAKLLLILLFAGALAGELAPPAEPPLLIDAAESSGGAYQSGDAQIDAS